MTHDRRTFTPTARFFVGSTPYVIVDGLTRSVTGGVEVALSSAPSLLRSLHRQELRRLLKNVLGGIAESQLPDPLTIARRLVDQQRLRLFRLPESAVPVQPQTTEAIVAGPGVKVATHWIEIVLEDDDGKRVPSARYKVVLPDQTEREGHLDGNGFAHVSHLPAGTCEITFPDLDQDTWSLVGQAGGKRA